MAEYTENLNLMLPNENENYSVKVANINNKILDQKIQEKVQKIPGKDLSTNDFSDLYKAKVDRMVEGTRGYNNYELAVQNGFTGTIEEYLESQKGKQGEKGDKGDPGNINVLNGVEEAEELSSNLNGSWTEGEWGHGSASGARPVRINIDNPPQVNIRKGWHFHTNSRSGNITQSNIPLLKNQIYTLSCYSKGSKNLMFAITHQDMEEGTEGRIERFETPSESENEWKKYSFSFESKGKTQVSIGYKKSDTELIDFYICGMRLEIGKPAEDGEPGKSAYEIAVENGFEGTVAEWLESLHGADGYTPIKGTDYFTEEDKQEFIGKITENKVNDASIKLTEDIKIEFVPENGQAVTNWQGCYYYKKGSKVTLHIGLNVGTNQRIRVFTMPEGFRPGGTIPIWGGGADGGVPDQSFAEIFSNGEIYVKAPSQYILAVVEYDVFEETTEIATMNLNNIESNILTRFSKNTESEEI